MKEKPKNVDRERRDERLRVALRENLKRRKAQARGRASRDEGQRKPHDSAGIAVDKEPR